MDAYLGELKPLLKGEEALHGAEGSPIRHIMPDKGFVNFEDDIPLYISGFGPRSLALAGKHGDGAVLAPPEFGAGLAQLWHMMEAGAEAGGRTLDRERFYLTALTTMVVLEEGEARDSERVKSQCGANGHGGGALFLRPIPQLRPSAAERAGRHLGGLHRAVGIRPGRAPPPTHSRGPQLLGAAGGGTLPDAGGPGGLVHDRHRRRVDRALAGIWPRAGSTK